MKQAIGSVSLLVRDYDEALEFYTQKLQFRVVEDNPRAEGRRWVVIAPLGSRECGLLLAKAKNEEEMKSVGCQAGGRVFLFLHTDDFWRDYREMKRRGIRFAEKPREESYGLVVVFEDLYGTKWDLLQLNAAKPPAGAVNQSEGMIHIRQIRESDIPSFWAAVDSVSRERRFLALLEAPPIESTRAFVAESVQRDLPHFVATEGEHLVGWCDAIPGAAATGGGHVGRLGMGVVKEYRGRKIGRRLLEATLRKAGEIGLEKIELCVFSSNEPAIALYRKLGFVEEGRRKRSRLVDGIYEDLILFALDLPQPDPSLSSETTP